MEFVYVLQPDTWKVIAEYSGRAWSVAGPLVGVFIGAYIANRNQIRRWVADNKREEYQEVLAAMSKTTGTVANADLFVAAPLDFKGWITGHPELITAVMEVSGTRILISKVLERMDFEDRFVKACRDSAEHSSARRFIVDVDALSKELRTAALLDIGI